MGGFLVSPFHFAASPLRYSVTLLFSPSEGDPKTRHHSGDFVVKMQHQELPEEAQFSPIGGKLKSLTTCRTL